MIPTIFRGADRRGAHGPQGLLMQRLARYAFLGWLFFGGAALAFVVLAAVLLWRTPQVVAVSRSGTILGRMEWLSAIRRSHRDILASSMRFVRDYLSANSATIVPDYVQALDMMADPLREATVAALKKTAYLARVRLAGLRSWVRFDDGSRRPRVLRRSGRVWLVRLSGVIHFVLPDGKTRRQGFSLLLTERSVARSMRNTAGIEIVAIRQL